MERVTSFAQKYRGFLTLGFDIEIRPYAFEFIQHHYKMEKYWNCLTPALKEEAWMHHMDIHPELTDDFEGLFGESDDTLPLVPKISRTKWREMTSLKRAATIPFRYYAIDDQARLGAIAMALMNDDQAHPKDNNELLLPELRKNAPDYLRAFHLKFDGNLHEGVLYELVLNDNHIFDLRTSLESYYHLLHHLRELQKAEEYSYSDDEEIAFRPHVHIGFIPNQKAIISGYEPPDLENLLNRDPRIILAHLQRDDLLKKLNANLLIKRLSQMTGDDRGPLNADTSHGLRPKFLQFSDLYSRGLLRVISQPPEVDFDRTEYFLIELRDLFTDPISSIEWTLNCLLGGGSDFMREQALEILREHPQVLKKIQIEAEDTSKDSDNRSKQLLEDLRIWNWLDDTNIH